MNRKLLTLTFIAAVTGAAAGIPEPDVVFHGRVTRSPLNTGYAPAGVTWSLSGNTETLAASQTTVVSVNGETFYLTRIPFETRQLADHPPLPATPNTLSLSAAATPYTRSATVDGRPAILPAGTGSFSYGAATQGLIERLDLVIGETFAEWSQRLFGSLVSQTADADGDGKTNYEDYLAGAEPQEALSRFFIRGITPALGGGFTFTWDSIQGPRYTVETSLDLQTWIPVQTNIPGTGGPLSFTDPNTAGSLELFYRVRVLPGP